MSGSTSESKNIEFPQTVTIEELIGNDSRVYEIPLFQRNYSWSIDNCKQLYDDIINSFKINKSYFIGIFMHYLSSPVTNRNIHILIDGQQRLTSIMLLLCAIRDVSTDKRLKNDINDFISNKNKDFHKFKFKLKENNFDKDAFEDIMGMYFQNKSKSNISNNYKSFKGWIEETKNIDLYKLFEHIKKLESVEIILNHENLENVQEIFEKINSTGKELTAADLIRNYLLFTGDLEKQEELYEKWTCIEKMIEIKKITHFVKSYTVRYSYEYVNSNDVYSAFKKQFKSKSREEILDDMIKYAVYYSIIEYNKYYEIGSNYNLKIIDSNDAYNDNSLRMLDDLGTDDLIPLFMLLYDKLYNDAKQRGKLRDILELLLEFMIRYRIAKPSAGGGSLNSKIYEIMKKMDNGECSLTVKSLYDLLSEYDTTARQYPTNTQFINALCDRIDPEKGRVVLYQFSRRNKREILDYSPSITLEHLMPQTIDPDDDKGKWWIINLGSKYQQIREKFTDCIGNYALLTKSLNSSVSNGPWPDKRQAMLERAFDEETRTVAKKEKWNDISIKKRNKSLSSKISLFITGPKSENNSSRKWLI